MVASSSLWSIVLLASASLVAGHGAIVRAVGDAGGEGAAIGVDPATPRDDTRRNSGQQDSTRFKGDAADACGETLGGGTNDVSTGVSAVMAMTGGLPQVSDGGMLMMTLHQVNGDGAGPYQCMIDTTGTGANWQAATVVENVPGNNGRDRDGATTDFPLTMQVPAGTTCTGTAPGASGAMCMARCENPANAGPFGGCVPFQMAGAGAAGNTTAAAPAAAAAAPAAAARKLKLRSAKMARRAVIDEETDEFWTKK